MGRTRIEAVIFDTEEFHQLGITPQSWMPSVNKFGGWYGRAARPGDVKIAFVAERVNENIVAPDWPPLYGGGSGLYLWRAISRAGMHPHEMYYTNAEKPLGVIDDLRRELHSEVLPDTVIGLGKIAAKKLWAAGVDHVALPHPAFWKRFHYSSFDQYVAWIREGAKR